MARTQMPAIQFIEKSFSQVCKPKSQQSVDRAESAQQGTTGSILADGSAAK
jgi:hypothetical protein